MTLFLKRTISADNPLFVICDMSGNEKYTVNRVQSKVLPQKRLLVTDSQDKPVVRIRRLPIAGSSTYALRMGKKRVTFVNIITAKGVYSHFYGNNYHIRGTIAAKNFDVIDVDNTLVLSHRRRHGYCELDISDGADELFCIAVSVCANMMNIIEKTALQAV